jgi:uncharacterized protein (DUF924 family)
MTSPSQETFETVLDFWFGAADEVRAEWFRKSTAFDTEIAQRFGVHVEAALRGEWDPVPAEPHARLATIVLLDQFTRNIFRGTPRAFAGDARALALARALVDSAQDQQLSPLRRWFACMPFEHAEDLAAQDTSVRLFSALAKEPGVHAQALAGALDYAERHRAVIQRFGRFPHRNSILGRPSTAEELSFLQQPGSSF